MSRIGYKPVTIPSTVQVTVSSGPGQSVTVKGPKGQLSRTFKVDKVTIHPGAGSIEVKRHLEDDVTKSLHGMLRSEIANMVQGVEKGYEVRLEVSGVGYKMQLQGQRLNLTVGYSHVVAITVPKGIEVSVDKQTQLTIRGADKQAIGQLAADIRRVRPPEPYQGKGIKYQNEQILRKEGKKGK